MHVRGGKGQESLRHDTIHPTKPTEQDFAWPDLAMYQLVTIGKSVSR
jgi:hypothetical protein